MPLAASVTVVATEAETVGEADDGALGDAMGVGLEVGAGAHAVSQTAATASRREHRDARIITAETPQAGLSSSAITGASFDSIPHVPHFGGAVP